MAGRVRQDTSLSLHYQKSIVDKQFKEAVTEVKRIHKNGKDYLALIIKLVIKPYEKSEGYNCSIVYIEGKSPAMWVYGLEKLDAEDFPHKYKIDFDKQKVKICLYYPKSYEWGTGDKISDTLVPWTALWLFFYEVWLLTGSWEGGGKHVQKK